MVQAVAHVPRHVSEIVSQSMMQAFKKYDSANETEYDSL